MLYVLPYGQMSLWGKLICPTCDIHLYEENLIIYTAYLLPFNQSKIRSLKRIGPHNYDILSVIFGSLLGDGYAEKHGEGTRICFQQEGSHSGYLLWLHSYISKLGYCNITPPILQTRIGLHGKLRYILRFKTFTFTSFNWIEECFYKKETALKRKILPFCIEEFLSPLSLAIWIMDDGAKASSGLKLCTNILSEKEVLLLCNILRRKFNLKANIHSDRNQYVIYIHKSSIQNLTRIVESHIHPSMKYKLNGYL
jgi:ubiquinol-cytochrome c reductase cytochrome b subunit